MRLNKNRILDASRWRPPQRIISVEVDDGRGGTRIEDRAERLPGQSFQSMLNPAGSVIFLPIGNANRAAEDGAVPYREQKLREKMSLGFLPWGRCPVAMVASQEISSILIREKDMLSEVPCTAGGFGPSNPCPHALMEQKFRRAAHSKKEAAKSESYKAEAERDREQREQHHEQQMNAQQQTARAIQDAVEKLAAGKPKK